MCVLLEGGIRELDVIGAASLLRSGGAVLLDVRTPEEYLSEHVEGAINIPLDRLEDDVDKLLDFRDRAILCFCRSGNRSKIACEILRRYGFTNVFNVRGGILAWKSELHTK